MRKYLTLILFVGSSAFTSLQTFGQTSLKYVKKLSAKTETTFHSPIFTTDGDFVIAAGVNGSICKWNLKEESPKKQKELDDKAIYAVAITPNAKQVVTGGNSGILYICDAESFEVVNKIEGFSSIQKITIAPNSEIAYIQTSGKCKLINLATQRVIADAGYSLAFNAFFSTDSKTLYHCSRKTNLSITNTADGTVLKTINIKKEIYNLMLAPDEHTMIVGVQEGYGETTILKIVNLETETISNLFEKTNPGDYGTPLCLVPNSDKIAFHCYSGVYTLNFKTLETKKIDDFDAMEMKINEAGNFAIAVARREDGVRLLEIKK